MPSDRARKLIVFDLDGVLVDFVAAANRVHGRDGYAPTKFNYYEDWGMTADEFWRPIHELGAAFWQSIDYYPWAFWLVNYASRFADVFVATTPARDPSSTAGKVESIRRFFGQDFRDYAITPRKWLLGQPGRLLIDDLASNVERFADAGGDAVLFPRSWNRNRLIASDPTELAKAAIDVFVGN